MANSEKGLIIMRKCKTHPSYKLLREPRSECSTCWFMWIVKEIKWLKAQVHDPDYGFF